MRGATQSTVGRRRASAVLVGVVAVLALSACTSSGGSDGGTHTVTRPAAGGPDEAPSSSKPAAPPVVLVNSAHGRQVSPIKPVIISVKDGKLTSVAMRNPAGRAVKGTLADDGSSWRSAEVLGYGKTYNVTAVATDKNGESVTKRTRVTTVTPSNLTQPYIDDVYGSSIIDNATYGVGMVARVHFDEPIPNRARAERALHVTTSPSVEGSWYWQNDQDVLWRPRNYYAPGSRVTITAKLYGVNVGNGLYGQSDQSVSFKIGAKHISIANAATHQVKVYFDDKLMRTMPTSMGRGGTVEGDHGQPIYLWTMPGIYTVINHENPATMSSDSYGLPADSPAGYAPEKVPFATKISTDGIYLHELDATVWAQGHQNVSHGCLNLNYANAKWFYNTSRVGDVVKVIHSGGPKIEQWQGGNWSVPWSEWTAGSALN